MAYISDIAFTAAVKDIQTRKGSRHTYAHLEHEHPWQTQVTAELTAFIAKVRSFFLATANAAGQPYIQHRGGPPGFLKVLNNQELAFADFKGNRQFISQGNLAENVKAFIFLIDYATQTRIKIWGNALVIEDNPDLLEALMPDAKQYRAKPEQVIQFKVEAWDVNCPQHIPRLVAFEEVQHLLQTKDTEIERLQQELAHLKAK